MAGVQAYHHALTINECCPFDIKERQTEQWPILPVQPPGNSCASVHRKHNVAGCCTKAKTFPWHNHLLSLKKGTDPQAKFIKRF
jgi:hypothetical protein